MKRMQWSWRRRVGSASLGRAQRSFFLASSLRFYVKYKLMETLVVFPSVSDAFSVINVSGLGGVSGHAYNANYANFVKCADGNATSVNCANADYIKCTNRNVHNVNHLLTLTLITLHIQLGTLIILK